MKPSLDTRKAPLSFSEAPSSALPLTCSLYEYHWDGPKRVHVPVWQPRQTTLLVVLDGLSRHLFSTVRILVYYNHGSPKDARAGNVWDIQRLGSVIHAFRSGQVQQPKLNASTLPRLTVAFEVAVGQAASKSSFGTLVLRSPASMQDLCRSAITVLLEHELSLTSDTLSLSLSFTHSTMLYTPITSSGRPERYSMGTHPASRIELVTTRIVRVLPPVSTRPRRIPNGCLPTELLIKTFMDPEFRQTWHVDLVSFAQVCRSWVCAMDVLHARLPFSEDDTWRCASPLLDAYALAKALRGTPLLGHAFRHFTTDNFRRSEDDDDDDADDGMDAFHVPPLRKTHPNSHRFTAALITILGTTPHLQRLHLGHLDLSQADTLCGVLRHLGGLHTLSIGLVEEPVRAPRAGGRPTRLLSVVQLARCMARWPSLTSLKIHHLHPGPRPGILGRRWRVPPPPAAAPCALTQLHLCRSHVADRDLIYLFAASGKTLERVVLDRLEGVTQAGLAAFLRAVSDTVVCLTVRDVALPPVQQRGQLVVGRAERALDGVVDAMPRLRELRLGGDVASEFMLDRRSKMFVAHDVPGGTRVPVVRLWVEDVPRLCGFAADDKWPGWCTPGRR